MVSQCVRAGGVIAALLTVWVPAAPAASQDEIDKAIQGGIAVLKAKYARGGGLGGGVPSESYGIGPTCLSGLALLENGVPPNDDAIKAITQLVREAAYRELRTYQISLCLMYLDRLGDPADEPLIQMLAVRLIVGQTPNGGWSYNCLNSISEDDVKWLKAIKPNPQATGKLYPEIEKYGQALVVAKQQPGAAGPQMDDNSNTQFAVMAVWMARKHGVDVERTLDMVERRFMATQDPQTGNWSYSGPLPGSTTITPGSPSMYCAGLISMATAVARREERRVKPPPATPMPEEPGKNEPKPTDPFAGTGGSKSPDKKAPAKRPADARDVVIQRAFAGLGLTMADKIRSGQGLLVAQGGHGQGDLYFLWSLERVGVVYGVDKIGGFNWYDIGSTLIVRSQSPNGSWDIGGYNAEVNTAFALLFLAKSNLARDLSSKVQKDPTNTELRAGKGPSPVDLLPSRPTTPVAVVPPPVLTLPNPTGDRSIAMAADLLKSSGEEWNKQLATLRDAKGSEYTRALVAAATALELGERKKAARDALAERLTRMTAATLRAMLKSDEPELRRAAALACAMKDDKNHIPDLIEVLTDPEDTVTRAAHAGLKSLTGCDFGPSPGASAGQKALAATAWRDWYAKVKK